MDGIDAATGGTLSGVAHLRQSIRDILTTPIGSRVLRREYGSQLFALVDAPLNASTVMDIRAATADALDRWEPRIRVTRITPSRGVDGVVRIDVEGIYLPDGREVVIDGIQVN